VPRRQHGRVDHHLGVHRIQRLHYVGLWEGPLDLLAQAIRVTNSQLRWHPGGWIDGVGYIDQHLACQVLGPSGLEGIE